jgi:two-component system nitrogen regulation response regulator GlnG
VRIHIPPLRERRDDIPLLINYFLKKFAQAQNRAPKSILPAAVEMLERFQWPGNVRELENVIQRATVMAKGDVILPGDLPSLISTGTAPAPERVTPPGTTGAPAPEEKPSDVAALTRTLFQWAREQENLKILPAVERELIIQALLETKGNQVQAAKLLGVTRATLRKRVEKFQIKQALAIQ